jgi:Beta/Gamma crystallin
MKPITLSKIVVGASVALMASALAAGEITLFERPDFQGRRLTIRGTMSDLDRTDFNDRAESIIVRDGVWEVCSDARFNGQCARLQPGEYRNLRGSLDRSISSAREVGQSASAPPAPVYGGGGGGGGQPRAILYSGQGMSGRAFEIDRNVVRNLDGTGFNDRAESLSVSGGYWIFCSDANFEGDCRTFGPGDYPNLPPDLNRRISSGRRIADRYPYEGRPTWQR